MISPKQKLMMLLLIRLLLQYRPRKSSRESPYSTPDSRVARDLRICCGWNVKQL